MPVVENSYFIQFQHHPFTTELFWLLFMKINYCICVGFSWTIYAVHILITPTLQYTNTVVFIVLFFILKINTGFRHRNKVM